MAELRDRHAQQMSALFREFLRLNPTIRPKDEDTWTLEQAEQWRRLAADENVSVASRKGPLGSRFCHEHGITRLPLMGPPG
jgi:hypothetical protein